MLLILLFFIPLAAVVASSRDPVRLSPLYKPQWEPVVPKRAPKFIGPNFIGLSFDQASWPRYAIDVGGDVNQFSKNLIDNIFNRTGGTPIIRLGGTAADYGRYVVDQAIAVLPKPEEDSSHAVGRTTVGPSFWRVAARWPDAKYVIQVPLATTNVSEPVEWVVAAVEAIGLNRIHSIQIGNEPDLYDDFFENENGYLGPPGYQGTLTNTSYVEVYSKCAKAIRDAISLPDKFFTAFETSAHIENHSKAGWVLDMETCFDLGLYHEGMVKEASQHYYQSHAGSWDKLAGGLMDVAVTHTNIDALRHNIDYLTAARPDVPFVLSEIGNSVGEGDFEDYQASLGSALWLVDFCLYSLSIGVARFHFHQAVSAGFDLWRVAQTASDKPRVLANYYAMLFLADFVGRSGKTQIATAAYTSDDEDINMTIYGAYEDGMFSRIAFLNLDHWNQATDPNPNSRKCSWLELESPAPHLTRAVARYLTSPLGAGADADQINWAGKKWSYDDKLGLEVNGTESPNTVYELSKDAKFNICLHKSEAMIVTFM